MQAELSILKLGVARLLRRLTGMLESGVADGTKPINWLRSEVRSDPCIIPILRRHKSFNAVIEL